MTAIAYITDSKMLENHRLLRNNTMNFWRLSTNLNFSDFNIGDLVFFLSKDKIHKLKGEKGIIGFGRLKELRINSPSTMWKRYGKDNGYTSKKEFELAIKKVAKDGKLPKRISSMYLTDIMFFQNPTYLSEYGMNISKQVESYVYLNDPKIPFALLEYAKKAPDSWTSEENCNILCDNEQIRICLFNAKGKIKDFNLSEKDKKAIHSKLKKMLKEHPEYEFISNSMIELCKIQENRLEIVIYKDKKIDERIILGQAYLYRYYLMNEYPYDLEIKFNILNDEVLTNLLNS